MKKKTVKPTVLEALDTVRRITPAELERLLKLNSLFNPYLAFSDTQLVDSRALRNLFLRKPTSFFRQLFEEDGASLDLGPTLQVCHRSGVKREGKICFEKVIEEMMAARGEPMLFSSLSEATNRELVYLRSKSRGARARTYADFLSIVGKSRAHEASLFEKYVPWLDRVFNQGASASTRKWAFSPQTYPLLVCSVMAAKEEMARTRGFRLLRTPSGVRFHDWLEGKLREFPNRSPLVRELHRRLGNGELSKRDASIYQAILDFPYNYNLAMSHDYALTGERCPAGLRKLFIQAGLIGNGRLEQEKAEWIAASKKKFGKPRRFRIPRRIDLNKIGYEDVQMVRKSDEFQELLVEGFLGEEDPTAARKAITEYMRYLAGTLPKEDGLSEAPAKMYVGAGSVILGGIVASVALIAGGLTMYVMGFFAGRSGTSTTDHDVWRR